MTNEKYYFSKEDGKYVLNFLDNKKFEVSTDEKSPYGKLYVQAFSISDLTSFSAYMKSIFTYNNIIENQISKTLYFLSLDRYLRMYDKFAFLSDRDIIIDDIEKLYNNKELQLKWNFILLHPICFEIVDGKIKYRNIANFSEEIIAQLEKSNYSPLADEFFALIDKLNIL